jgi:hypothetical protein
MLVPTTTKGHTVTLSGYDRWLEGPATRTSACEYDPECEVENGESPDCLCEQRAEDAHDDARIEAAEQRAEMAADEAAERDDWYADDRY